MFPPAQKPEGFTPPSPTAGAAPTAPGIVSSQSPFTDAQLLEKFKRMKGEAFDQRWVYERQWMRNVWYILGRQWIVFDSKRGQWQDKRVAKWVPRPVTNIVKDGVNSVRANIAAIKYGANARPIGDSVKNVVTAGVADKYIPVLYDDQRMDQVMNEFDFWALVTGNAWLHTCLNYDRSNGVIPVQNETCVQCQETFPENEIAQAGQKCPSCGGSAFMPAVDPTTGMPQKPTLVAKAKTMTIPLSPFEVAFPLQYERYSQSPFTIRMRWRDKSWYENHAEDQVRAMAKTMNWSKSPTERTMQIFKTLPFQNDLGMTPSYFGGGGTSTEAEGVSEFDVWIKPCGEFPDGQVIRFVGDQNPVVFHSEQEKLPGPLPYHSADGDPLFTFTHAEYDHIGGRSLGAGLIDPVIQKQDQLNQIDSLMLMIIMRTANPIWLEPKGAEVEKFTGEPGLVVKWNPLLSGGNAKPERIPGENIPASLFTYRSLVKQEAEEGMSTFDIMKGQKPVGVDSFAGMNLLVERGQARHSNFFISRSSAHRDWAKFSLELEREYGEETRIKAMQQKTKGWAFETFKKADLSGNVEILLEDGTMTPKTNLGERAAIEHLSQLQLINRGDQDQVYKIYQKFGMTDLLPGLDAQVQECAMKLEAFGQLMSDPQQAQIAAQAMQGDPNLGVPGQSPLVLEAWDDPNIFRQEVIKWCVSDDGREVFAKNPLAKQAMTMFLMQINQQLQMLAMQQAAMQAGPQKPPEKPQGGGGAGRSAANSNANAGGVGKHSSGAGGTAEPLPQAA